MHNVSALRECFLLLSKSLNPKRRKLYVHYLADLVYLKLNKDLL